MKSEDYALLIGSVAASGAVALTMTVTRNLDWCGARMTQERAWIDKRRSGFGVRRSGC